MVSAPDYPNQYKVSVIAGEYWLVKYSEYLFAYIDLLDNEHPEELTLWEVFERLCQAADYIPDFNRDGNFNIYERATGTTTVRDFTNLDGHTMIKDIWPSLGDNQIFNQADVIPYVKEFEQPSVDCQIKSDSLFNLTTNDILCRWSKLQPIHIILLAKGTHDSSLPEFKYKSYFSQITTSLSADTRIGATEIPVNMIPSSITNDVTTSTRGAAVADGGNGGDETAAAAGDYKKTTDGTYTVRVTTGGAFEDPIAGTPHHKHVPARVEAIG